MEATTTITGSDAAAIAGFGAILGILIIGALVLFILYVIGAWKVFT